MSGTDRQLTQAANYSFGEGFAFFAWHRAYWPELHNCEFSRGGICAGWWIKGAR